MADEALGKFATRFVDLTSRVRRDLGELAAVEAAIHAALDRLGVERIPVREPAAAHRLIAGRESDVSPAWLLVSLCSRGTMIL